MASVAAIRTGEQRDQDVVSVSDEDATILWVTSLT